MNSRYRYFIIHEIQIPSIAYDVIYAYNLKNQHFPFNRNIFLLMSHAILKHFCRCWYTVISLPVEFGRTHFSKVDFIKEVNLAELEYMIYTQTLLSIWSRTLGSIADTYVCNISWAFNFNRHWSIWIKLDHGRTHKHQLPFKVGLWGINSWRVCNIS